MAELGDISGFLAEGSITNLDWLEVSEEDYRRLDNLPKQNLDVVPDLEAAWSHTDQPASRFVPNVDKPYTMGDLSEYHGPSRTTSPEDIGRTARLLLMQSSSPRRLLAALRSRFDSDTLCSAASVLKQVMAERGLLGGLYVQASDFPECSTSKQALEFVRRYAPEARFVLAKKECVGCIHRQKLIDGSSRCGIFHKEIQVRVPYSTELAEAVEKVQVAKGIVVTAAENTPKERIQVALLGKVPSVSGFTGHSQPRPVTKKITAESIETAVQLVKDSNAVVQNDLLVVKARPVVALLRREMLKGRGEAELIQAMRLAFDVRDLQETRVQWEPFFLKAGLYGAVYSTQDSFEDCREGADFLNKHGSKVRAIVAGAKCESCIFAKVGRCLMYGRKLISSVDEILTPETVALVLEEHRMSGRLTVTAARQKWGSTPADQLKALHRAASTVQPVALSSGFRGVVEKRFCGQTRFGGTSDLVKREILKAASQYLNEGLYGQKLAVVLRSRFEIRDLSAVKEGLRKVLAEQGLQGIKFIDPSVYDDYGHGCATASRLHRSRAAVKFAKVGDKCANCVHQTIPGVCSILNKQLVVEPPYIDKLAEQKAILASGFSTQVSYNDLMHNGLSTMQEYQLQQSDGAIELNPSGVNPQVSIEFGPQEVEL